MSAKLPARTPPELFAVLAADLRYFERRPERRHRLRLAAPVEIEEGRRKAGLILPPEGLRAFCAILRLSPGSLHREIGFAINVGEVDFDEKTAAAAYLRLCTQDVTKPPTGADLWHAVPAPAAIGE
ncbi:hypothetical protein [Methylobacterium sp. GC_Met_2]|uniref:hypothetical protein n=1 Tax=Methylobacterium sp. GC_Met_2 TaxID=2937376 RepID=UPI00226BA0ED|nr:hypothetical protein [Methylobacterium sp. GC_Met_2]